MIFNDLRCLGLSFQEEKEGDYGEKEHAANQDQLIDENVADLGVFWRNKAYSYNQKTAKRAYSGDEPHADFAPGNFKRTVDVRFFMMKNDCASKHKTHRRSVRAEQ